MAETLETIAAKLTTLGTTIGERLVKIEQQFGKIEQHFGKVEQQFGKVEQQFGKVEQQFAETNAHLGVKIEAVDTKVTLLYDAVLAHQQQMAANAADHQRFSERLDDHDVRILALEPPRPATR